jgi:tRNA A-37 threonylcarbamoyl transferase component Bud32
MGHLDTGHGFEPKGCRGLCVNLIAFMLKMVCHIQQEETRCPIEDEYQKLCMIPQSTGLPIPPKAFFPYEPQKRQPACIIQHLYDVNFKEWSKAENRSLEELCEIAQQLAIGINILHVQLQMTHGDLWMQNVMIDIRKKRAHMIDFGLAFRAPCDPHDELSLFFKEESGRDLTNLTTFLRKKFQQCIGETSDQYPDEIFELFEYAFRQKTATAFFDAITQVQVKLSSWQKQR